MLQAECRRVRGGQLRWSLTLRLSGWRATWSFWRARTRGRWQRWWCGLRGHAPHLEVTAHRMYLRCACGDTNRGLDLMPPANSEVH